MQDQWDERYRTAPPGAGEPARVLRDYGHLLPPGGVGVDLACGLGANALFLARRGLHTLAWDLSPVAVQRVQAMADAAALPLTAAVRDVIAAPPPPDSADAIVVAHFLERGLAAPLMAALRPGGLLFFQTFTRSFVNPAGPTREVWRLADQELLALFAPLRVLAYREEGRIGDLSHGFRDEAMLVGVKP